MANCTCEIHELTEQQREHQKERVNGTAVEADSDSGTPFSGGGS